MHKNLTLPATAALLLLAACDGGVADKLVSPNRAPENASLGANANDASSGLKLTPSGFGQRSHASWKPNEGLPDSKGNSNFALYFQKMTTTATFAAGVAKITGLEGQPVSAITGLSWEHRTDGWCGAGAPRWDIIVADESGDRGVIFLGCAAAAHTPGSAAGWIRDSYPGAVIATMPATGFTSDFNPADDLTISELLIVFDEGTDIPGNPGYVFLDNITVNDQVFTRPGDNGN